MRTITRICQACLLALAIGGCTAAPAQLPTAGPGITTRAQDAHVLGALEVHVRWPKRDLPGFQAQVIPGRTRSLRLTVRDSQDVVAGQALIVRQDPNDSEASGELLLPAGSNYRLLVEAFSEQVPGTTTQPIAVGNATNLIILRSRTTVVPLTLTAVEAPMITALMPTYGLPGSTVTLHGAHFGHGTGLPFTVTFGGLTAEATRSSDTEIVARVPAQMALSQQVNVQVTVDGVPSASVAPFLVAAAGLDVWLGSLEDTYGSNGLTVSLDALLLEQGFGVTLDGATPSAPSGIEIELK